MYQNRQCGGSSSCVVSGMSAMGVSLWFELTMYILFCYFWMCIKN